MGWREGVQLVQESCIRSFSDGAEADHFDVACLGFPNVVVRGVFRARHVYVDARTTVQVSTDQPTLDVLASDLPSAPRGGDLVTPLSSRFAGQAWRVSDAQFDGEGIWKLFLVDRAT